MSRQRPHPPAPRDGVNASCVVVPAGSWGTVLDFLAHRFDFLDRGEWARRMDAGDVLDARGQRLDGEATAQPGMRLYYYRQVPPEPPIPFQATVLWENEHLLVTDKPHFLPVVPSGPYLHETLLVRLRKLSGIPSLSPVHRIDRDTAGLVLFAKQPADRAPLQALFRTRQVDKVYECIAPWNPQLPWPLTRATRLGSSAHFMQQTEVEGPVNAITQIEPLEIRGALARYRLCPVTGQRHQLRVHMAALGLPIVGDGIYPVLTPQGSADFKRPLQLLAQELAFVDPFTGQPLRFVSQLRLATLESLAG